MAVRVPIDATTERTAERKLNSKTWNRADGKRILQVFQSPVHYDNNGTLEDIDLVPTLQGQSYNFANTSPYFGNVQRNGPGFTYVSRANPANQITTELVLPPGNVPAVVDFTDPFRIKFLWAEIFPDVDVEIQLRTFGIVTYTTIKTPTARHSFDWQIIPSGTLTPRDPVVEILADPLDPSLIVGIQFVDVGQIRTITVDVQEAAAYPLLVH